LKTISSSVRTTTQLHTSRTGTRKPVGAPFAVASQLKLCCVLAMHTGMCPNPDLSYCTGPSVGGRFANRRPRPPGISPGTQSQSFPECFSPKGRAIESFWDCWRDRPVRRPGNVLSMQSFSNSNFGSLRCNAFLSQCSESRSHGRRTEDPSSP